MPAPVRTAIFPVAGLGTRVLPATKAVPKEMLPVVDKPVLQYVFEEAAAAGVEHFVFVTGRGKSAIEDHFDSATELEATLRRRGKTAELEAATGFVPPPGAVSFTRQQAPLGLGHAVWCARNLTDGGPVAVLLPDVIVQAKTPCLKQLMDVHASHGGNVVAVEEVPLELTHRYGVVDVEARKGRIAAIRGMVEKPDPAEAPSNLSLIGRYILAPQIFDALEAQTPDAGGEIQLTDAMARLIGVQPFHALIYEGRQYDCGDKIGYLEANVAHALERPDLGARARAALAPYFA